MPLSDSEFWKVPRYIFANKSDHNTDEMVPMTIDEIKKNVAMWDENDTDNAVILQVIPTAMELKMTVKKEFEILNLPSS